MLTTIFLVSLCVLILMLVTKSYEIRKQKEGFLKKLFSRFDEPLDRQYRKGFDWMSKMWQDEILSTIESSPKYAKEFHNRLSSLVTDIYSSSLPNIRGMRKFRESKKISPYLQDIHEYKEQNGKGRIDD